VEKGLEETMQKLKTVKTAATYIIDDAYGSDGSDGRYPTRESGYYYFKMQECSFLMKGLTKRMSWKA
jgi:hypothetical protein